MGHLLVENLACFWGWKAPRLTNVKRLIIMILTIMIIMHTRKEDVAFIRRFSNVFISVFIVFNENISSLVVQYVFNDVLDRVNTIV